MHGETQTLLGLLIILFLGLIVPEIFKKTLHLPFVTSIIIIGSIFGPYGLNLIESNEVIEFFGFLGFTFLMLMAGMNTHMKKLKKSIKTIGTLAIINACIPLATGIIIGRIFGYSWMTSLLLGTIFTSSSVAIIISFMKSGRFSSATKDIMLPAFIIEDLLSMIMLASIFQSVGGDSTYPLPLYFLILLFSIAILFLSIPPLARAYINKHVLTKKVRHEDQLRFVIVILIAVLLYFSALGVHPILAAFLVGMLLADLVTSETILVKIETMGYGLFVPVFFFIVGMDMDLTIFAQFDVRNVLIISVIGGLILSKFLSGYIGGRLVKLKKRDSAMFGSVSTTQLTTTLAAAYAGSSLGLLDETLVTAVVTLSVVTNLLVPLLMRCITPPEPKGVRKIVPTIGSSIAHPGKLVGKKTDTLA
tara:strand:- start:97 stop:1350 length:1254 start_codon:yes stop_codon:yes gene_type:complete